MSRIEVNAGGRHIIVDHDGELEPLRAAALALWRATETPERPGPAVGFTVERRSTREVAPTARGPYGRPPIAPVTAQSTMED